MSYKQGDMLMLYFPIPGNSRQGITHHPGVVVSGADLYETEGLFFAVMVSTKNHNPQCGFELTKDVVTMPSEKYLSFIKCHLLNTFDDRDADKRIGHSKEPYRRSLLSGSDRQYSMAKKSIKTYQIVVQSPEDQAFVSRLLEIYGYQEGNPGMFSEKPQSINPQKSVPAKSVTDKLTV